MFFYTYERTKRGEVLLRLDKYLADCGIGTRSEIKKIVRSGAVTVDDVVTNKSETKVDETSATVCVNGCKVSYKKFVYLMLNKPSGYVSAMRDNRLPTVADLIPEEYKHFDAFPMGRLDMDTVGLLILTNDGELTHKLLSPSKHVPKTYIAKVDGKLTAEDTEAFENGMDLGDFVAKPAKLKILSVTERQSIAEVVIEEGKFRQVRRMFEKVGKKVTYLKRVKMNLLELDETLAEGEVRELTDSEFSALCGNMK